MSDDLDQEVLDLYADSKKTFSARENETVGVIKIPNGYTFSVFSDLLGEDGRDACRQQMMQAIRSMCIFRDKARERARYRRW